MTKFCVKKPYLIVVAVVIVLVIGFVSLTNMKTDLLPNMELPYMVVITTEPGAAPEKVENDVTKSVESVLGTVSGVKRVTSSSAENYSMVMLEFADDTDMNAALVRVSQAVDTIELPDNCGKPNIMEISMDMMATMYASVEYDGKDIKDMSKFTKKILIPYVERQDGVASVSGSGSVEDSVEIRLDKKKIDKINDKILFKSNKKLKDAQDKIDEAKAQLGDAEDKIKSGQSELTDNQNKTNKKLADANVAIDKAQATLAAYEAALNSTKASQAALEAEKKAYKDAKVEENYKQIDGMFAQLSKSMGNMESSLGFKIPSSIEEALQNPKDIEKLATFLGKNGYKEQSKYITKANLQNLYNAVKVRLPQIDTELANLKTEILAQEAVVKQLKKKMKGMDKKQSDLISGGYSAAAGFGTAGAQIASGQQEIDTARKELKEGEKTLKDSKKAVIENSNIDALLTLETLSGIITAQNFSMPAGYIDDKNDTQWLVKVGQEYKKIEDMQNMVLTKIKGVGNIKLSDVAAVTVIDNEGDSYAKINGKSAILLSIFKASTENTSEVSDNLTKAFKEMEEKYEGLSITPMVNQADYISMMLHSILSSILLGAVLAIIVLALFLKDVRPTLIVAFSIPFSVLFAVIIMYFTNMTLNVMSLAGLCLGIGMLVDNSIVVIENVYRLRNHGLSPARAAVQGARQVAAPIVASTLTTICVFMPMVFVNGLVSQLLIPFALTISYALVASLAVALTIVPTMGSVVLKNESSKKHDIFDRVKAFYGKILGYCLKVKIVPLAIAIVLLVICIVQSFRTGLVMMDDADSDEISITMTLDKDTDKETAYKTADEVMEIIAKVDGIRKVAAMDGNATASAASLGAMAEDNFTQFMFFVVPEEGITSSKEFRRIRKDIEKKVADVKCEEMVVSSSSMGGNSGMMSSGMQINIYGEDQEKLVKISKDIMKIVKKEKGFENVTNGLEKADKQLHLEIDKNKAAKYGLTVAQIYQQLATDITTEKKVGSFSMEDSELDVNIVDETGKTTYENILDTEITATTMSEEGQQENKTYKLSKFAKTKIEESADTITRENQVKYMSVQAEAKEGQNVTLLSRKVQDSLDEYKVPDGYTVEIQGETEQVMDMIVQLLKAIALGFLLIYLIMVAQFQSLLSPFIIIFTIPLAFTGGMIGLMLFGQPISAMALMGFMILMGTVVNNGIVFVDYVNQLRIQGMDKRTALITTGKVRMRPILMTALTTILSMSVLVFSQNAGNAMQKPMAIVVCFGLIYATFMTLFVIPVMYDILYRKTPKVVDVGDDNLDEVPDETVEVIKAMRR